MAELDVAAIAERLVPGTLQGWSPVRVTGNNRVFRIASDTGTFALKFYPSVGRDRDERIEREFGGLGFLTANGMSGTVPTPVARDDAAGAALYSWLDGEPLARFDGVIVDALLAFLHDLHALRGMPNAQAIPDAREATRTLAELLGQVEARLARLRMSPCLFDRAQACLDTAEHALAAARRAAEAAYEAAKLDPAAVIPTTQATLSPSDFGVHNAVRLRDGRIGFVDFEYFGWDDPVKLTADTLWHPAGSLANDSLLAERFRRGAASVYGDAAYHARLAAQLPIFGLRWCCICLNEFLPDRLEQRRRAGELGGESEILERQLVKAEGILARVREMLASTMVDV
ncbi:phosphotransferase [Roseiterribacter gracilis]|uniref:Aminoglycoside phosphotransferase n=1 Tax=Roseiterribacter gracilis TaxID=2812848 RepID=A0A8S8XK00_9PROT|nr:aminoglycoside phosphotransferase [Rhodospirillales bacterium TMPK1]